MILFIGFRMKQNNRERERISSFWGWGEQSGLTTKCHEGTLLSDGNILHLDCGYKL